MSKLNAVYVFMSLQGPDRFSCVALVSGTIRGVRQTRQAWSGWTPWYLSFKTSKPMTYPVGTDRERVVNHARNQLNICSQTPLASRFERGGIFPAHPLAISRDLPYTRAIEPAGGVLACSGETSLTDRRLEQTL